jgi:hypothetical protein
MAFEVAQRIGQRAELRPAFDIAREQDVAGRPGVKEEAASSSLTVVPERP